MREFSSLPNSSPTAKVHVSKNNSGRRIDSDKNDIIKETGDWLPRTLVIENRTVLKKERDGGIVDSFIGCISNKKVIYLIIVYAFLATGLWTWFFTRSFGLLDRGKQAEDLKEQVDKLDSEIDELEDQVDRLASEVTRLGDETDRLEDINEQMINSAYGLNESLYLLADINSSLNATDSSQAEQIKNLAETINDVGALNEYLMNSLTTLGERIETISTLNVDLDNTIENLQREKESYKEIVDTLESSNVDLVARVESLEVQLVSIEEQNDSLEKHNEDLRSIIIFLDQAGIDLNSTVEGVAGYLSEEISENEALVLSDLKLSYQNVYFYWTCSTSFEFIYSAKPWMLDRDISIGVNDYDDVIEFIDEHVLTETCASKSDFVNFLVNDDFINYGGSSPPVEISINALVSGVERYSTMMMYYYFSQNGNGLTEEDWNTAKYNCQNIPVEKRYIWNQQ